MIRFSAAVILISFLGTFQIICKQSFIEIMNEGFGYHEMGQYDKAIETYEKALEINPTSPVANYEIAYSYFSKGAYSECLEHVNFVLSRENEFELQALLIKGSALDMLGRTDESIELFETAIEEKEENHLLYYNLALNYFKISDIENAEKNATLAIRANPLHSSSHLIIADIHTMKRNTVQSILASHFFLVLESNTRRSVVANSILEENLTGGITKNDDGSTNIEVFTSPDEDNPFSSMSVMIGLLGASKNLESNENKSDNEIFHENTKMLFGMLKRFKKENNEWLWWSLYAEFFDKLNESTHMEAYCNFITQSVNEDSQEWLNDNRDKFKAFQNWLLEELENISDAK